MNIKITYNWLLDYLGTDASPYEIQKYLSLCGSSVEKVEKVNNDYVLNIEITSNRVDSASVFGIAQECLAILPQFVKKAKLKINPLEKYNFAAIEKKKTNELPLTIKITNKKLCSRFTAIVLKNITIKSSPQIISQRLKLCDIKSINNVVDISNYLMLSLGQPVHIFDYEKIKNAVMILRESKKGEKIITLDNKEFILEGEDIIIEDGSGELIDLCGIMGGLNSAVSAATQNIVLFVQNYNSQKIRRTSMNLGQRTSAASYFEKGLDSERVESTAVYGIELLTKYANAQIASKIYDIYPKPYQPKTITILHDDIKTIIGVETPEKKIISILKNLGFSVETHCNASLSTRYIITIPSYRKNDISIKEDIIEEIARIYGYFNLPSNIQKTDVVKPEENTAKRFNQEFKIKHILKNWGLNEVYNYSMISAEEIKNLDLKTADHLKIENTISQEICYLRTSLIPSLLKNISFNESKKENLTFFEIANVYIKEGNDLPNENRILGIAVNSDFSDLKGIIESLFDELHIDDALFTLSDIYYLSKNQQVNIIAGQDNIGIIGKLLPYYQLKFDIKKPVYLAEIFFGKLIEKAKFLPQYKQINPYALIKLDLTIEKKEGVFYQEFINKINQMIKKGEISLETQVELLNIYQNKITLRFYFSSANKNITEEEAKEQLEKIKKILSTNE